jgi:hypothetical protein
MRQSLDQEVSRLAARQRDWQRSGGRAIIKGCDRPHGEVPKWSYRDRLESDLSRKRHVGSNPTLSANLARLRRA